MLRREFVILLDPSWLRGSMADRGAWATAVRWIGQVSHGRQIYVTNTLDRHYYLEVGSR